MRIGILSMHRVVNCGSFLQAYGLRSALESTGNHEVEFIDFHNSIVESVKHTNIAITTLRKIKHFLLPKYWAYERTLLYDRKFHKKMVHEYQRILFQESFIEPGAREYDLVVVGSDEVFNICQFAEYGKPIPWELLGEGIQTKRLVSYAAACGQTSLESIEKINATEHCKRLLNRFDALSARDDNTLTVLQTFGRVLPEKHIDPVLLLKSFPKDDTYTKLPFKYLLVYAYSRRIVSSKEIAAIKQYAKAHSLKIVNVNCFQTWSDVHIVASPFALLQYVQDAECVVTDTFHGTIFSIRNHKPFATLVRSSNSNKLHSLLVQFGLGDRELKTMDALSSILDRKIDYAQIEIALSFERKKAYEYLNSQI